MAPSISRNTQHPRCPTTRSARWAAALCAPLAALAVACGPAATAPPAEMPDQPVPSDEPRAELRLEVDLRPAQDCEEAFDLALYEDRGIELIAWDDAADSCEGRLISVRYLSRRIDAEGVRELARRHAVAVHPASAAAAAPPPAPAGRPAPSPAPSETPQPQPPEPR